MEKTTTTMMELPEGCLANVISLTTPQDACKLSSISKDFKSAADSDAVWDKFLPPETKDMLDHKSKKELYLSLSDHPILIDDGKMSFSVDKWSGKKCYMIAARRLRIASDNTPEYWTWESIPESRFKEAARLRVVCWLEIRGRIETRMLSPSTMYKAYLVYKISGCPLGLHRPLVVTVGTKAYGFDYDCPGLRETMEGSDSKHTVVLLPRKKLEQSWGNQVVNEARFPNESRKDGWLEMELGEFLCRGDEDEELEMICCEIDSAMSKAGLLLQGIEVRPVRSQIMKC